MKSIDTTKMNDKKTKKRADQYKEITEKWRNDFITEINKARETRNKKGITHIEDIDQVTQFANGPRLRTFELGLEKNI